MAKNNEWDEHTKVPEFLQKGAYFQLCQDTFTSSTQPLQKCLVQLDEYGFFVRWRSQEQEAQLLDCNQIREICNRGYQIKDQKAYGLLAGEVKNGNVADRIIILVCGADMVNWSTFLLLAEDAETAQKWIVQLRRIIHNPLHHNIPLTMALKKHWMKLCFMANRDMKIPVKSITRPFSAGKNPKLAVQILKSLELANSKNDVVAVNDFTFEKFYHLYQAVCIRTDIEKVFCTLAKGNFVEAEPLAQWMNEHQRDPRLNEILFPMYDHKRTRPLIKNFEPVPELAKKGQLSLEGFSRYLSSLENSPVFRKRLTVFEDMDQPLCHYSINSSHNTYLNGRQFIGDSSVEMYRQVLLSGCRCIELDCWDGKGENQGEPIITHGKAMCTDINFIDVIHAINETAFVTSDYPVILSFENHCSKPQQLKLAQYCDEVFGEKLLKKPLDEYPLGPGVPLPSPSSLRRKIIIKNKRLKPDMEKVQLERYYRHSEILEEDEDEENHESPSAEEAHPELRIIKSDASQILSEDPSVVADITGSEDLQLPTELSTCVVEDPIGSVNGLTIAKSDLPKINGSVRKETMHEIKKIESASEMAVTKPSKSKLKKDPLLTEKYEEELLRNYKYTETSSTNIHSVLSNLINYCQSVKFQGFKSAEEQNLSYHMSSFSESTGVGLLKTNAIEFVNYNKRQLSRIYPRGNRVDSSNYMPQVFWNAGCQMVSLNFQTSDISMQLNQGRFEFNGVSGYLLKPEFMRRDDRQFDPFSESPVDGVIAAHCSIEVISGLFLSDKQIGTYVEVDMYGLPTDTIRKEHRTKLIQSNGLNPVYNSEPFVFRRIILPNLTLMRFAVHDENGKLLGQRVIPLESLQCGYRYISLRSASGHNLHPATLFCNIVIKSYVPDGLSDFVNALADPKKYLSIADARASQMRNMGIDEDDLSDAGRSNGKNDKPPKLSQKSASDIAKRTTPAALRTVGSDPSFGSIMMPRSLGDSSHVTHRQYLPSTGGLAQQNSVKDLMQITPVTVEMLAKDPVYQKLAASQTKEIQRLQGKLQKERQSLERKHKEKLFNLIVRLKNDDNVPANSLCCFAPKLRNYINTEEDFKERLNSLSQPDRDRVLAMQKAQKDLETDLTNSYTGTLVHMSEHHKQHQIDALKHILESTHNEALKKLKGAQEKEMADLTQHQTKSSLLSTKGISLDKSIKRAEKDRRVREMSSSNAKKFYEERQMMSSKHARQIEKVDNEQKAEAPTVIDATKDYVDSCMKEISFGKNRKSETPTLIHVRLEKTLTELSENVFTDSKCETIAE